MMNWKMLFAMLAGSAAWGSPIAAPSVNYGRHRPTGSQLRNPADPVQAARIEAAAAKREARAEKRTAWATNSFMWNVAHYPNQCGGEFNPPKTFNPFYIAK